MRACRTSPLSRLDALDFARIKRERLPEHHPGIFPRESVFEMNPIHAILELKRRRIENRARRFYFCRFCHSFHPFQNLKRNWYADWYFHVPQTQTQTVRNGRPRNLKCSDAPSGGNDNRLHLHWRSEGSIPRPKYG